MCHKILVCFFVQSVKEVQVDGEKLLSLHLLTVKQHNIPSRLLVFFYFILIIKIEKKFMLPVKTGCIVSVQQLM